MCFGEHYTHGKLPNVLTAYFQYLGLNIMSSTGTLLKKKRGQQLLNRISSAVIYHTRLLFKKQYEIKLAEIHPYDKCLFPVCASIL